jgi:hypothetical protein
MQRPHPVKFHGGGVGDTGISASYASLQMSQTHFIRMLSLSKRWQLAVGIAVPQWSGAKSNTDSAAPAGGLGDVSPTSCYTGMHSSSMSFDPCDTSALT